MKIKVLLIVTISLGMFLQFANGQEKVMDLPQPDKKGGMPLMEALNKRHSERNFSSKSLSKQTLSNLIWAAFGINRPESGKRTAPSAKNQQEIDIYVTLQKGLYKYLPEEHSLKLVKSEDIRKYTGEQGFVDEAPLNLVYVADYSDMEGDQSSKLQYSWADTGFIGQNAYLYCASKGLNCVIRGWINKGKLRKEMELKEDQKVILSQTVGYPK